MQKNQLSSAQISSGIVILFIISVVSIIMSNPAVGLLGAFGQTIFGVFSLVRLLIGLAIGIAICIAFFIFIWFGVLKMAAPDGGAEMYESFRVRLGELLTPVCGKMGIGTCDSKSDNNLTSEIQSLRSDLKEAQKTIKELQTSVK